MSYQLVAEGGIIDAGSFASNESRIPEGSRAQIELDLRLPVTASVLSEIESRMRDRGIPDTSVTGSGTTRAVIRYRKGFPWLAVIAAIILAIAVLAVLIVGWRIFREVVPADLQPVIGTIGIGVVLLVLAAGAVMVLRR